jgi:hypothetical protein
MLITNDVTISENYFEAMRQDTASENVYTKIQLSKFIFPLRGIRYVQY